MSKDEIIIVGICGRMEAGKTCLGKVIDNHYGLKLISFASEVKNIAKEIFGWDGLKNNRGRKLLQSIGTDTGRQYDPYIWINKLNKTMEEVICLNPNKRGFVIDDLRFNNEAKFIKSFKKSIIICIKRKETIIEKIKKLFNVEHKSEKGISKKYIDFYIDKKERCLTKDEIKTYLIRELVKNKLFQGVMYE